MVNILIEHGANVNTDAGTEYSPLATAIERGYYDIFQLLLDKEAQINTVIENQPMSKEMVLALHQRNILLMIELICRGATITKHACKYSKLSNVDDYSDEYKIKIYDLLKKYKIETANDINSLELVADTKEILKDKLFPVEPVIRSTKIINLKFF
jgi:ankyrin repeat protein